MKVKRFRIGVVDVEATLHDLSGLYLLARAAIKCRFFIKICKVTPMIGDRAQKPIYVLYLPRFKIKWAKGNKEGQNGKE